MSHTLHREGTLESLKDDICIVVRPERHINGAGSAEKVRHILDLMLKHHASNYGDAYHYNKYDNSHEVIRDGISDGDSIFGVFATRDDAFAFLADMVEYDCGISLVLEGLYDDIKDMCHKVHIKPHTTNHSLGVWGKTEKLPPEEYRPLVTMCGHGMVPFRLIQDVEKDIRSGRITLREGAEKLAKPCACGIFNADRAEKLLVDLMKQLEIKK